MIYFILGLFLFLGILGIFIPEIALRQQRLRLMLRHDVSQEQIQNLQMLLRKQPYVAAITYVSPEEGLRRLRLGKDFMQAMEGFNPIPPALEIQLKEPYLSPEWIERISHDLITFDEVYEISYPLKLLKELQKKRFLYLQLAVAVGILLLIITYLLVFNTIKLVIFSKRFLIRTMQLIGATRSFIERPFIRWAIFQGFIAAVLAILMLYSLLLLSSQEYLNLLDIHLILRQPPVRFLFLGLLMAGIIMSWLSSKRALHKYLNKSLEELN